MSSDARLDEIQARYRDCLTYNFGMHAADKLAHEDVAFLLAELRKAHEALARVEELADKYKRYGFPYKAEEIRAAALRGDS